MINEQIKDKEVRLVDANGEQAGVMPLKQALKLAQERQMDLVKVAPKAKPPVCRIMDYGKFKYEQSKKERESRKKQKVINIKEIRMSPNIDEHDFMVRVKNAQRFLKDGDKIKIAIRFRGREITHKAIGEEILQKMYEILKDIAVIEKKPNFEGRNITMVIAPKAES